MGETVVFVTQPVDVAHEFSLTGEGVEHWLLHEISLSFESVRHVTEFTCVKMLVEVSDILIFWGLVLDDCEDLNKLGDVLDGGVLVNGDADSVLVDLSEVDAVLVELGEDLVSRAEVGGMAIEGKCIEEIIFI